MKKGIRGNQMQAIESELGDFELLRTAKVTQFKNVEELEKIKFDEAYYFIAGEMKSLTRNNENVIRRSVLALDYDGLNLSEEEFKQHLLNKIKPLEFYAYPTIRHQLMGLRYRVILKLDRPYTKEESEPLTHYITRLIGLKYDESSKVFSQMQGLPTTFEEISVYEQRTLYNEGIGVIEVDRAIQKQKEWKENHQQQKPTRKPVLTVNYQRKRTFTAQYMESLLESISEGERNQYLTSVTGKLFSLGMQAEAVYEWIHIVNDNFIHPPLFEDEVNTLFGSILKSDQIKQKGGN
ncbi:primase alpha helix C-terminal domain-containing protein [Lacticigenium naphthae]|uniref:primase alpha helix C-terminal domain-containing protein n=1 Tax=Lacticigenium naphthae TaxID=515351 RepID=UPI0012EBE8AE|nr:primase alpha helix C-terminal domain-containing protein [Lacticigenium naphthae]